MTDIALHVDQTRADGLIGASDAAAILGIDSYRSPLDVWLEMRGEKEREDAGEPARWGQVLEPVVRGQYALQTGSIVCVPRISETYFGWLRCTPDGYVVHGGSLGGRTAECEKFCSLELTQAAIDSGDVGLYQGKTCSAYLADEWSAGKIPAKYEVQCRVEMAVTGLPWCDIVCLVGGQHLVGPVRILRDLDIERAIIADLLAFWNSLKTGEPPPVDASEAWRDRAAKQMREDGLAINADDDVDALLTELSTTKDTIKQLEVREKMLVNSLLVRMGTAGATKLLGSTAKATAYGSRSLWSGL